ncbi:MAG: hypothetical protein GY856_36390 [bacterium]|nr:hypothetical protein [bacterium]
MGQSRLLATAGYVVLVLTIAMTFLFRPAALAGLIMPSLTQPELPKWKSWPQALALIRFFGATQRALDAWLRTHEKTLDGRVRAGKEGVETRNRYVDLGNEDDLAAWQVDATSGKRAACWITGPGGCGKSTLAFRMARDLHVGAYVAGGEVDPVIKALGASGSRTWL